MAIMIGVQGSGKSTFCEKFLSSEYVRVNLDTLTTRNKEKLLFEKCLSDGSSMVIDNTNPSKADRQRYIPAAKAHGYRIIGYYMGCDLAACIERNNQRTGKARVPERGIYGTLARLERPCKGEGFDELYYVINDGEDMKIEEWIEYEE